MLFDNSNASWMMTSTTLHIYCEVHNIFIVNQNIWFNCDSERTLEAIDHFNLVKFSKIMLAHIFDDVINKYR